MLPYNLLRAKISRGKISPLYVSLDSNTLTLAERIISTYREGIGKKKGELLDKLRELENEGQDYKLVRGLSALLERQCKFEVESVLDPVQARMEVFEEASRERATTSKQTEAVLLKVAKRFGIEREALEKALFSDIEEELVLKKFSTPLPSPEYLLKKYNLSLTQTLLFKSLRVEFTVAGNWKNIFRGIKRLGLIYSIEKNGSDGQGSSYVISLDGPLSLFKLTERYGTSIAKLLPQITATESWSVKAEILARNKGNRVYLFEADSKELGDVLREPSLAETQGTKNNNNDDDDDNSYRERTSSSSIFDSSVEEKFARSFASYGTGWKLKREPEPLLVGRHVLIPDFSFEKYGKKVYLEVVGFWTPGYLERKIEKLRIVSSSSSIDMIIAADESLACAKLERLKERALVFYYKREVPVKPVIEHLKKVEASVLKKQAEAFRPESLMLKEDVVSLERIAQSLGLPVESLRLKMQGIEPPAGYVRAGEDLYISKNKLDEVARKLEGLEMLTDALKVIQESGFKEEDAEKVLNAAGYLSVWEGIDVAKAKISKVDSLERNRQREGA
jgi:predicted nuclease of restriction endonuclease-like RecB superfamily